MLFNDQMSTYSVLLVRQLPFSNSIPILFCPFDMKGSSSEWSCQAVD